MAYCDRLGTEVELEAQGKPGIVVCPACGEELIEETLERVTQAHYPTESDTPASEPPIT